jgi:hypothetical protein
MFNESYESEETYQKKRLKMACEAISETWLVIFVEKLSKYLAAKKAS